MNPEKRQIVDRNLSPEESISLFNSLNRHERRKIIALARVKRVKYTKVVSDTYHKNIKLNA